MYTNLFSDMSLLIFMVATVHLELIEFTNKHMHRRRPLNELLQHVICTFTPLGTSHPSAENTHKVWLCPLGTVLEYPDQ